MWNEENGRTGDAGEVAIREVVVVRDGEDAKAGEALEWEEVFQPVAAFKNSL